MAIWHHARLASSEHDTIGWLGRTADVLKRPESSPADSVYIGAEAVPVALRGRRANSVSLETAADLKLVADVAAKEVPHDATDLSAFVQRSLEASYEAARRFSQSAAGPATGYPATQLAGKLHLIAQLLKLGGGTRIYYASQPGYDTHSTQAYQHTRLLREFSAALAAFLNDLKAAGLEERVIVMAFSEFGRRVQENGSAGTDHGAAAPLFLAGGGVRGGLVGRHPSLTDLDRGDLKMSIDFRQVYATLLTNWIGASAEKVLGQSFSQLDCLQSAARHAG
jgi:uncharacterized protein (DUF1501 family)